MVPRTDIFGQSMKVRMGYIDQLRSLSIVDTYLMPNIIHMLRLDQGLPRAFKLDQWAIDEFYVSCKMTASFLMRVC